MSEVGKHERNGMRFAGIYDTEYHHVLTRENFSTRYRLGGEGNVGVKAQRWGNKSGQVSAVMLVFWLGVRKRISFLESSELSAICLCHAPILPSHGIF